MSKSVTVKNMQGNTKVIKTADLDVLGAKVIPVSAELKKQWVSAMACRSRM